MFNRILVGPRRNEARQRSASLMVVVLVAWMLSAYAVGQTDQMNLLPGNGAPLLVTPEVHLSSPSLPVGASNATAGNTAGATNATVGVPLTAKDPGAALQYSGPAYSVTITPNPATLQGAAPSTPEIHLGTAVPQIGATTATAGNTAGAANATTALPVMPRSTTTLPEYTVRGSTVTIIPPPQAIPSAQSNDAGINLPSTDRK